MRRANANIFLVLVVLLSSCVQPEVGTINSVGLNIDTAGYILTNKSDPTRDSLIDNFPSLSLNNGESLTIVKFSRGCFHYHEQRVEFFKSFDKYSITYTKTNGNSSRPTILEKHFDSIASNSLSDFRRYCKHALRNYVEKQNTDSFNITTINKLYLTKDGEEIVIPGDVTSGWDGFGMLVKSLNFEN